MATDEAITADSQVPKNTTGQTMALVVYQSLPLHDNGTSRLVDDFKPMDEKFAAQQSMDVDDYLPPPPLCIVRPESLENERLTYAERAKRARTKRTSTCFAKTYVRKRGRPLGAKSAKGMVEQKPALFDGNSGSSSYRKDDDFEPPTQTRKIRRQSRSKPSKGKFDYLHCSSYSGECKKDIEPSTPTRKRGRPRRSQSSKRKVSYVDSSSSSSEGWKHKDCDFEIEVCDDDDDDDDDGHKKYARVKGSALDRAEKVMDKLPLDGRSFVKCMEKSQVSGGYWLGLPAKYCRKNLPKHAVDIILEDEEGLTCETRYLAYKTGLSGGWGPFARQHKLKVGDALVFQLVEPTRFKIYILRKDEFSTTDGALGLLSLDTSRENNTSKKEENESPYKGTKSKEVSNKKKKNVPEVVTRVRSKPYNDSDNVASQEAASGGIRSGGPDFVPVDNLEDFNIHVGDGSVVVDRVVLPDHLRLAYYTLCCVRMAFLHRKLSKEICTALATGMIMQTAIIAEGIMAASHALEDLVSWKKTLEFFESLNMDVAFMCERVDKLIDLLSAPLSTTEVPEGYEELKLERDRLAKQLGYLQSKVSNLKNDVKDMDVELEMMREVSPKKMRDQAVQKLATAPW